MRRRERLALLDGHGGIPLFERLGRRVRLTAAGGTLLGSLEEEFARIDNALAEVAGNTLFLAWRQGLVESARIRVVRQALMLEEYLQGHLSSIERFR
jgi:hypothetical protein